jgi:hypothetical protein
VEEWQTPEGNEAVGPPCEESFEEQVGCPLPIVISTPPYSRRAYGLSKPWLERPAGHRQRRWILINDRAAHSPRPELCICTYPCV